MFEPERSFRTLSTRLLPLVFMMLLAACATTRPNVSGEGPRIARDPAYNSGNFRPYTVRGKTYYPRIPDSGHTETGVASWYGGESPNRHHGRRRIFLTRRHLRRPQNLSTAEHRRGHQS